MTMRRVADTPDTPGHPAHAHWEACTWDDGSHVHVVPVGDVIPHSEGPDGDCVCGPTVEFGDSDDGPDSWLLTHHSLDGRERYEEAQ